MLDSLETLWGAATVAGFTFFDKAIRDDGPFSDGMGYGREWRVLFLRFTEPA